jgi:peptidyl-tRNA hydrolase, PTH1 family
VDTHFLVVGLGNPGPKYQNTRHNFGFMTADGLAFRIGETSWKDKFSAETVKGAAFGADITIIKPLTFMNLSGRSVVRAMQFFNIEIFNVIVIHDELDLDFGTVRLKKGGGCAGHKGLLSIKQETGSDDFLRVRMGIGRPEHGSGSDYVLSAFSKEESVFLKEACAKGSDAVQAVIEGGIDKAMNAVNRRPQEPSP